MPGKKLNKQGVADLHLGGYNGNRTKTERKRCYHFFGPTERVGYRDTMDEDGIEYREAVYARKCLNCGDTEER